MGFPDSGFVDRFVEYSADAKTHIHKLTEQYPRLNQSIKAIYIFLQVSAHCGKTAHSNVHIYVTNKYPNAPALECYYTFNDRTVTIHGVYIAESMSNG